MLRDREYTIPRYCRTTDISKRKTPTELFQLPVHKFPGDTPFF